MNKFDTNVIIKEVDSERRFEAYCLPIIKRIADTTNLRHIFEVETRTDDSFHRTKILNDMVMESTTDVVVNYDTDIILPLTSYTSAVSMLEKDYDVVYPYRFGKQGERKVKLNFSVRTQDDMNNFENYPESKKFIASSNSDSFDIPFDNYFYYPHQQGEGWAEYGMVQFFNRKVYMDGFLENEGFIAYAPEDVERHHRWKTLGYRIGRVDNYAYHLEHERTQNSWFHNPHMQRNNELWEKLKVLDKEQLTEYYKQQDYVKERLK
ncbi:MAG: hypothetical protein CBB96_08100 [Gammaproteobacteria bacterium TMED36]|nr:MAG: hypothetical protein CBB96_08100 [Gammaproteobacteria bacterium TMED36]